MRTVSGSGGIQCHSTYVIERALAAVTLFALFVCTAAAAAVTTAAAATAQLLFNSGRSRSQLLPLALGLLGATATATTPAAAPRPQWRRGLLQLC